MTTTRYEVYQCEPAGSSDNYPIALAIGDALLEDGQRLFIRDSVTGAVYDATNEPREAVEPESLKAILLEPYEAS